MRTSSSIIGRKNKLSLGIRCPGCAGEFSNLDHLNFHLTYGCSSREPKRLRPGRELNDEYLTCPACLQNVKGDALNFHLDMLCSSRSSNTGVLLGDCIEVGQERKPPGLVVFENFLTLEEERRIVNRLFEDNIWYTSRRNGKCLSRHWGIVIDYSCARPRTRFPEALKHEEDMPDYFNFIIDRFKAYPTLASWVPNECNANLYNKTEGDFLTPHFDDRTLSGEIITNVNLLSDCIMTFSRPGCSFPPYKIRLPRLSASVISRSARYDYTHAIENRDLLDEFRISLNFRKQSLPLINMKRKD